MENKKIDWMITLVPLVLIVLMCVLFFIYPSSSNEVLNKIRFVVGDRFGIFYLILGLGIFLFSLFFTIIFIQKLEIDILNQIQFLFYLLLELDP